MTKLRDKALRFYVTCKTKMNKQNNKINNCGFKDT